MSETLAFVFADLESSTRLWEELPEAMAPAMERHDAILRDAVESAGGRVVKVTGDGMMAVFSSACDALDATLAAQRLLVDEPWGETGPLRVRMGIHVGEAQPRAGDYFGPAVNRTARIMAAAHGGQVLLSSVAAELARERVPPEADLRDLGEHRLKDLSQPQHLFQLVHPALMTDFPPLSTLGRRPNNLPTQTSAFLGRETQLAAIRNLLDTAGVRLLTLTGPGGIGKTRLALQAAADQIDRFDDGVFFVDLSSARQPEAAFEVVAQAVGVSGTSEESPIELVKQQLETKRLLLILDNLEQVIDAAEDVADLLRRCSEVKTLVTSREALRVRGEHLLTVPPLEEDDAVRLFVERATEVQPDFALTDGNAAAVAEISARLEGLPLGIELAAARLGLFSPQELSDRLGSRLELLRGGARDLPARQRTLRGTIEWSYELLDPGERTIFKILSVFAPTRVEAVEAVVGRLESASLDAVDRLASLVDKSLVRGVDDRGRQRLSMLETIREYAVERLEEEPDLARAARRTHAEHFAELAQRQRERLFGPERAEALDELEAELGNLRTTWRHWVDEGDVGRLAMLLDPLWVLHDARGWYRGTVELTNDLLGVLSTVPPSAHRAQKEIGLLMALGRGLMTIRGYTDEVEDVYGRALALAEEAGELPRRVPVLRSLASFKLFRGEFAKTEALGRELLELAERDDDVDLQVDGQLLVGSSLAFIGDLTRGLEHLDRAIALFDPARQRPTPFRFGPSPGVAAHTTSAFVLWLAGHPEQAAERAQRAVELARRLQHPFTLAYTLFHVGFLDFWRSELALATERARDAMEVAEEHDFPIWSAVARVLEGAAIAGLGRPEEGLARVDDGIARYEGLRTPPVFWPLILSVRARGSALAGRPADGLQPIREAVELAGERAILYPEFALLEGELLLALGDADAAESRFRRAFDAAGETGARMCRLRAATSLARLKPGWTASLRDVYDLFTEGFATPDLLEARAVLDQVDARVG